jgi:hypothetical protein
MPQDFYCNACHLGFSVGWFHYHHCPEGYGAQTLLVCSACGTMHAVEHPSAVWVPVLGGLFQRKGQPKKRDRLLAQDGPFFLTGPDQVPHHHLKQWHPHEVAHELCPKSKYKYMRDFIDLAPVECHHCRRPATLVKDWACHNVRCPACGKPELVAKSGWIT